MNINTRDHIIIGAGCLAIGFGTGYIVASKRVEKKYRLIADDEIAAARLQHRMLTKQGEFEHPETAFQQYVEEAAPYTSGSPVEYSDAELEAIREANALTERALAMEETVDRDIPEVSDEDSSDEESDTTTEVRAEPTWLMQDNGTSKEEAKTVNIFDRTPPTAAEVGEPLHSDEPYVITLEEYQLDEKDYAKDTITYYDGDDTLADDQNEIIPDVTGTIGSCLTAFNGTTVIYVRNDRLQTDFEVCLDASEWTSTVLGIHPDEPPTG